MYRQGDVLLIRVEKMPARSKPVKSQRGRLTLARGEATGHHHSVSREKATLVQDLDAEWMYLQVHAPVEVEHQEHAPVTIEPGIYEVRRQREWSDAEEPIRVQD